MNCDRNVATVSHSEGLSSLWCRVPAQAVEERDDCGELSEKLERTPVSAVMTATVTCVDSELDLNEVAGVLKRARLHAAPVVEDAGVLLGVVSQSDLLRGRSTDDDDAEAEDRFPPDSVGLLVEDVMTTEVAKLAECAPLAEAARVFARNGVHLIPIVSNEDVVVGTLSVMDLVRWIARQPPAISGNCQDG